MSQPPSGYPPPYEPLSYAQPMQMRPGILTAVGIISIIVGALSALASLSGIASGILYLRMGNWQMVMPVPTTMPAGAGMGATTQSTVTFTTTGGAAATTVVAPGPVLRFNVARGASALTIIESALSVCAAALLIVAGSMLLANKPSADRLHRIYVALKIPQVVMAAIATWWVYTGMMSGMFVTVGGPGQGASFANTMALVEAVIFALISLVYPVALLIVFSTGTSRRYFETLRSGMR